MRATLSIILFLAGTISQPVAAQEKPKPAEDAKPTEQARLLTPLRVQVVLNEYDGEKRISSLPYSFELASSAFNGPATTKIKSGVKVPIATGSQSGSETQTQYAYIDIGTRIDCRAFAGESGRYKLQLQIERGTIASGDNAGSSKPGGNGRVLTENPVFRSVQIDFTVDLRDGQTIENVASITDPLNGHVHRINLTMNVVK
jgi:hypothetical protein